MSEAPCNIVKLENIEFCSDVIGRYKIEIQYTPDGKEHQVSCCFAPSQLVKGYMESGERLECMGYYSDDEKTKLSIGLEADIGYGYNPQEKFTRAAGYDYDACFEEKGGQFYNSYEILPFTQTNKYVFGVAWIENCNDDNDVQTWFSADPTIMK